MNRQIWADEINTNGCPPWPCCVCNKGTLVLVQNSLSHKETVTSAASHNDEGFDFDWVDYVFTAWAKCSYSKCGQEYAIAGTGGVFPGYVESADGAVSHDYFDFFIPKACVPMPDVFAIPAKCPDDIASELRAAFALFWSNKAACASRIRVALEYLMSHVGVPLKRKKKNGKFYELTLHDRIDTYAASQKDVGTQLMALKWLGNTGSHDSSVGRDDLLDAFEILEHVLQEIVEGRSKRVAALAKQLTIRHKAGKRSRKSTPPF